MKYRTQCKTCDSMKYPPTMKYPPDYIISNISFSRRCAIILNQTTFVNCVNARMPPAGDSWMSEAQSEHLTHLMRRGLRVMTRLEDPDRKNALTKDAHTVTRFETREEFIKATQQDIFGSVEEYNQAKQSGSLPTYIRRSNRRALW